MPVRVATASVSRSCRDNLAIAAWSPDITVLNGSAWPSFGLALTTAGTRSRIYITWLYTGCSTQSVPSWSKVAMRCCAGTKVGFDWSLTACTNSTIACLVPPSFQEGNGSVEDAAIDDLGNC